MPKYQYRPLDVSQQEIRLVTLHPRKYEDSVEVSIHHVPLRRASRPPSQRLSLDELAKTMPPGWTAHEALDGRYFYSQKSENATWIHPDPSSILPSQLDEEKDTADAGVHFEALSYAWGPDEATEYIYVRSGTSEDSLVAACQGTLFVRQNLITALRHLRSDDRERTLWIDAISIDQSNMEERSEQVRRMKEIFKLADHVNIWIGPGSEDSSFALAEVEKLGREVLVDLAPIVYSCIDGDTESTTSIQLRELDLNKEAWLAIERLFKRPYFTRLWVWQEVRVSYSNAILHCGQTQLPWWIFANAAVRIMQNKLVRSRDLVRAAIQISYICLPTRSDLEYFESAPSKMCQDPRDRLYGLLGVFSPEFASRITPSYSHSIQEVYQDAFFAHLDITQRLELPFQFCYSGNDERLSGPSWIPNFSHCSPNYLVGEWAFSGGVSSAEVKYEPPNTLVVTGVACGKVEYVDPYKFRTREDVVECIRTWAPGTVEDLQRVQYTAGGTLFDAYCSIFCGAKMGDRLVSYLLPKLQDWKEWIKSILNNSSPTMESDHTIIAMRTWCHQAAVNRNFVKLDNGHIGIGPPDTQIGDTVTVMLGSYSPTFLREIGDGKFQVVGSGYIHGLSDAIAFLGHVPAPWKAIIVYEFHGFKRSNFQNESTGEKTPEDPRLGLIPEPWERLERRRERHDPECFDKFRNKETGELINSDPRMLPDALRARGVDLKKFQLV